MESESLDFTGLKIPRDYLMNKEDEEETEEASVDEIKEWKRKRKQMRKIVEDFCKIKYTTGYKKHVGNKKEIITEKRDCSAINFIKVLERHKAAEKVFKEFEERVEALSPKMKDIMYVFLDNAPKNFGQALTRVMEKQEMSEQDILKLVGDYKTEKGKRIGISHIQSFMDSGRPTKNQKLIPYICRALLIDESVLYKGYGYEYGTWKYYFSEEFFKDYITNPETGKKEKNIRDAKKEIRGIIKKIIVSDGELMCYLGSIDSEEYGILQQIHKKTKIDLFETKKEKFENLLEPDSAYALLETLEKMP